MRFPTQRRLAIALLPALLLGLSCKGGNGRTRDDSSAAAPVLAQAQLPLLPVNAPPAGSSAPTPEWLLEKGRVRCDLGKPPAVEPLAARDHEEFVPWDDLSHRPQSYAYAWVEMDNSPRFGRVVRATDAGWGHAHAELAPRTYIMGHGLLDSCNTTTYSGVLWSGFGVPGKALLDTEFFPLEATLVDNRQRSPSCAEAAAPLTFTEASSRGDVLSRYGVPEPRPLFPRTGYASGRLQIPREGAVAPAPVCPFFARAGQSVKRSLERCEVGTYFVEDDLPQLGKLVILEDFGEACDSKESWISGARVYVLGQGKVDACGSVAFEPFPKYSEETPVLRSDRGTGHSLAMYDHRDRRASQECSPKPAIELVEEVLVWSTVEGRRSQRTLRRAFYAPVIQ